MPTIPKRLRLFEVTGMGVRYRVVDRTSLQVRPIVHQLFEQVAGRIATEVHRGDVTWNNGPAAHVLELKTTEPTTRIGRFEKKFQAEVRAINEVLEAHDAMLLPAAMHPFMDPTREAVAWPHDLREDQALLNSLFDRRAQAWCNVQRLQLELPFATDDEFTKLHAAVRLVLPLIPALCSSSPIVAGRPTGSLCSSIEARLQHQARMPALMGPFIPEAVFDQEAYYREIYAPIGKALARQDPRGLLLHHLVNARAAVARFDRGFIEIHVIDMQECVSADLAVAEFIVAICRALTKGRWVSTYLQRAWNEADLMTLFRQTLRDAGGATITNREFLFMFGMMGEQRVTARRLLEHLFMELKVELSEGASVRIDHIVRQGCLAERILRHTGRKPTPERITEAYAELAACLKDDRSFDRPETP